MGATEGENKFFVCFTLQKDFFLKTISSLVENFVLTYLNEAKYFCHISLAVMSYRFLHVFRNTKIVLPVEVLTRIN